MDTAASYPRPVLSFLVSQHHLPSSSFVKSTASLTIQEISPWISTIRPRRVPVAPQHLEASKLLRATRCWNCLSL